jgi:cysteinyl-tRNA synthetase
MSKSLGNFFTIKEILNKFDAEVIRFFLLSTHYRSPIEFSDEQLRESESSIDRHYTTAARISDFLNQDHSKEAGPDEKLLRDLLAKFGTSSLMPWMMTSTRRLQSTIFELIRAVGTLTADRPAKGG